MANIPDSLRYRWWLAVRSWTFVGSHKYDAKPLSPDFREWVGPGHVGWSEGPGPNPDNIHGVVVSHKRRFDMKATTADPVTRTVDHQTGLGVMLYADGTANGYIESKFVGQNKKQKTVKVNALLPYKGKGDSLVTLLIAAGDIQPMLFVFAPPSIDAERSLEALSLRERAIIGQETPATGDIGGPLPLQAPGLERWNVTLESSTFRRSYFSHEGSATSRLEITAIPGHLRRITVWIRAFIPGLVPGVTRILSAGPHKGESVVKGPPLDDCYLTDQRAFDSGSGVTSRMESKVTIDLEEGRFVDESHRCGETTQINCDTGAVIARKTASAARMNFTDLKTGPQTWTWAYKGAAFNPISPGAAIVGDIDIDLRFELVIDQVPDSAELVIEGHVDDFPAFEAYARAEDNREIATLFTRMSRRGMTPIDGIPGRPHAGTGAVKGKVLLKAR